MKIIYMPGMSLANKRWIEGVKAKLEGLSEGKILDYDHWHEEKRFDIEAESRKLASLVKDEVDYGVLAKSVGVILALKNISENKLRPKAVIFLGFPYRLARSWGVSIDKRLRALSMPMLLVQNEFDPAGSHREVEKMLRENPPANYQLVKIAHNSTHDYSDLGQWFNLAKSFWGDNK